MAKRIGIFIDVSNLYYCLSKKFNRKLNYQAYYDFIKDLGEVKSATAYGAQVRHEAQQFIMCLKHIGFDTKYKLAKDYQNIDVFKRKADWDVGIAMDIVRKINDFDLIVLGSADGDLAPAVEWAREQGTEVLILACGISRELKSTANKFIEITETMLEEEDNDKRQPRVKGQPEAGSSYNSSTTEPRGEVEDTSQPN